MMTIRKPAAADADARWSHVVARDKSADGTFVYAVRSTGVYCRPSCPSRRPRPERVLFYEGPAAAEAAGFRACRRCRPRAVAPATRQAALAAAASRELERGTAPERAVAAIARRERTTPSEVRRAFRAATGISPRQYAEAHRTQRLKQRLRAGESITGAMYDVGLGSSSRLYERAPRELGMTPAAYRNGAVGERIDYTITASPLGRLLVAATERGICAVKLGDDDASLVTALRDEFSQAGITRAPARLDTAVRTIVDHLAGHTPSIDLPVDVRATAFQRRVWRALRDIPVGETRTYKDVARAIGRPTAARAVARACATNPVALIVPCHRVVRADGDLGGYRWGIARKRDLLEREAARLFHAGDV